MNEYETEEQQIEALKKWWKENATSLIFGLAVGVSGLFGWRYYVDMQNSHAAAASDMYTQIVRDVVIEQVSDNTIDLNNQLINDFSDTPYAALSSLMLAKSEYEKGNVENALTQLELAVKNASDNQVKQLAVLRLASVYIEQGVFDKAEQLLNQSHDSAYDAHYEELKGDLYQAKGDTAAALAAYNRAIELHGISASRWLKLKRDNIGLTNPANDAG
jgi:predicted negative regulator of RcsB-dependent stress response